MANFRERDPHHRRDRANVGGHASVNGLPPRLGGPETSPANAASRHIGRQGPRDYVGAMPDATRTTPQGPAQIHAPLQAWFAAKEREPAPEHMIALVDELEVMSQSAVRNAG